jgi:hypothetical protein
VRNRHYQSTEGHTVARIEDAPPKACHSEPAQSAGEEPAFRVQLSCPSPASRCGNHLEILWQAAVDRIFRRKVCL